MAKKEEASMKRSASSKSVEKKIPAKVKNKDPESIAEIPASPEQPSPVQKKDNHFLQKSLIVIFVALFIIFIIIAVSGMKFRFLINDELIITLTPNDVHFNVTNKEPVSVNFTVTNNNFAQCRTICNFTLIDLSRDSILSSQEELMERNKEAFKEVSIPAQGKGTGESLYQFQVECYNIKSAICLTDQEKRFVSSTIFIDYSLDKEEESIKQDYAPKIQGFIDRLDKGKAMMDQDEILLSRIPDTISEKQAIMALHTGLSEKLKGLESEKDKIEYLWKNEEYAMIPDYLSTDTMSEAVAISSEAFSNQQQMLKVIGLRNSNVQMLLKISAKKQELIPAIDFFNEHRTEKNKQDIEKYDAAVTSLKGYYDSLSLNKVSSESAFNESLQEIYENMTSIMPAYEDIQCLGLFETSFIEGQIDMRNLSTANINIANSSRYLNCERMQEDVYISENIGSEAMQLRNSSFPFTINDTGAEKAIINAGKNMAFSSLVRINNTVNQRISENRSSSCDLIARSAFIPSRSEDYANITEVVPIEVKEIIEPMPGEIKIPINQNSSGTPSYKTTVIPAQDLYKMSKIDSGSAASFVMDRCLSADYNIYEVLSIDFLNDTFIDSMKIDEQVPNMSNYSEILPEPIPQCCFNGECKDCCDSGCAMDPENYPVIFVHGHAIVQEESPQTSFMTYVKIQKKMQDDGFIDAGIMDIAFDPSKETYAGWKRINSPITVRTSYYFISYYDLGSYSIETRKSERIENYAIRLKERIDMIKYRTGAPKVNIVAHSMGGLVVRDYLSIFGYNDVNKVITTNSPHHGISGRIRSACYLTGATTECDDMSEDSVFIKRINSEKIPESAKFYVIRSTGCQMDNNQTGDGIVTDHSSQLDGAENIVIHGKCTDSLGLNLHNEALDPEKYPEVYNAIVGILREK